MLRLAVTMMRRRPRAVLGAGAAVAMGAIMVMSSGILLESAVRSEPPVERLEGASVVVQADPTLASGGQAGLTVMLPEKTRLDAGLADRLARLPGVARAVADRSFDVTVELPTGDAVDGMEEKFTTGHGWSSAALTPYHLIEGRHPEGSTEIVLGLPDATSVGVGSGDALRVACPGSPTVYTVVGVATTTAPVADPQVFFRDDVAAALAGPADRADLIGITTDGGASPAAVADRVSEVLPEGLRVLTGDDRGGAESPEGAISKEDIVAGLTTFGALAAFVSVFVVSSAFALSIHQRHRELALLRAIGGTRRQVRRLVAAEALAVAVAATVVAAPASVAFAALERWLFVRAGLLPEDVSLAIGWLPFTAGLVAAILTTQLAAMASARRASRIRPTEALREAAAPTRRTPWPRMLAGLTLAGLGFWVLVDSVAGIESGGADTVALASMVWIASAALLGPVLARPFTGVLGIPVALFGKAPGFLARVSIRTNLRRVASVATPVMLTVALGGSILISKSTLQQHAVDDSAARTTADLVLRTADGSPVPVETSQAMSGLDAVEASSGTLTTSVVAGDDTDNLHVMPALAVNPRTIGRVMDLDVTRGSLADLRGNTLAVREGAVPDLGRIGDLVEVNLGDGTPVTLRIAATYARGLGFADVVVPRAAVAGHTTHSQDDAVLVRLRDYADPEAVARRIEELAAPGSDVQVLTRAEYVDTVADEAADRNLEVYLLLGIVILFCGLSVVNTVSTAIGQRTTEFALLGLLGASPRQVIRMVRTETLIIVAFGTALGLLIAAPTVAVLSYSVTGDLVPAAPVPVYTAAGAALLLVGLTAGSLPARRALRQNTSRVTVAAQ